VVAQPSIGQEGPIGIVTRDWVHLKRFANVIWRKNERGGTVDYPARGRGGSHALKE